MAATGNSRFAVTCGLLRQYMMREQPHLDLGVGLRSSSPVETEDTDGRTMELFPKRAGTSPQPSHQDQPEAQQAKAPLTIFYEGRMLVFDDFPADKAKELMQLAGSGSSQVAPNKNGAPGVAEKPAPAATERAAVSSDLPIARKMSLQRFLQKRKERIGATEPYSKLTASPAPEKDVLAAGKQVMTLKDKPAASWLGL